MPFLLNCNNKGCFKKQNSLLNPETNEVICGECGMPISGISDFTKRQMKSMGEIIKENKKEKFSVRCNSCNKSGTPEQSDNKYVCKFCKKDLNLSPIFINMLKQNAKE